ncbi:class I SAM-dependent methyltransferase [Candidatus Woesearchaeota archaeon]|nr:class I SAM-dependent methyltransferase [Candidatus Woesearchaeota archaeon]
MVKTDKHSQSARLKHSQSSRLKHSKDDLRWATNELVADWRAARLACERIADIGCGIGLQSFSFRKKCRHVIGIDIDGSKIMKAKKNAGILKFRNIEFFEGDALSPEMVEKCNDCEAIFLDPERDTTEDSRKVESIRPNIYTFLKTYEKITDRIAIEFPPQIKDVPLNCEREYASVDGKLNRLTLYFGPLKRCEKSAVVLPGRAVLLQDKSAALQRAASPQKYLYEVDGAVHKAGLLPELCQETKTQVVHEGKFAFMTSKEKAESPFFRSSYRVLGTCKDDPRAVKAELRKCKAASVVIRFEVDPKEYWNVRKGFEQGLDGNRQVVLFDFDGLAVVCEKT